MSAETDQADRVLLAERVMRWVETEGSRECTDPEARIYRRKDRHVRFAIECGWNPFANAAEAIEVMETLHKQAANLTIIIESLGGIYGIQVQHKREYVLSQGGTGFARTLTTTIVRLVRERPELFGGAK